MVSKKSVRGALVKEVPRGHGGRPFPMHPGTKSMLEKVGKLKPGQILKFKLKSQVEADNRAKSLRDLRKKKRVSFTRVVQRGNELYVEK